MKLEGETVLFDPTSNRMSATNGKCKWRVHTNVATDSNGIMYRDQRGEKIKGKGVLAWGALVDGVQVDKNWVRVGQYLFLPIYHEKLQQVLWPQNTAPVHLNPSSSSSEKNEVRIYLLAPKCEGEYRLTGTVAGGWENHLALEAESVSASLANMLEPQAVYYLDLPVSALQDSEFKFQRHVKEGFLNKVKNYFHEVIEWEYEDVCNRTVKWDGFGSTLYMCYGRPEASHQDVVDFLKVALSGPPRHDMNLATRKIDDVQRSVVQVRCKGAQGNAAQVCIQRCLHDALSQILTGSIPSKPCGALYMWLAVLEHEIKGNLQGLHPLARRELTGLIAVWPVEVMSHAVFAGCVHRAAKEVLFEEARLCPQLPKQWLQAAIQVILHGEVSSTEILRLKKHAAHVPCDVLPQWGATAIQSADVPTVESALRVAFGAADRPALVWHAAFRFMENIDRQDVGQACACITLAEVLTRKCTFHIMNWEEVILQLDFLLDKLAEGGFDVRLQQDLTSVLQEAWNNCYGWRVRIPAWTDTKAMRCLAMALVAEPFRASQVAFQDNSDISWLGLAAIVEHADVGALVFCLISSIPRVCFHKCA